MNAKPILAALAVGAAAFGVILALGSYRYARHSADELAAAKLRSHAVAQRIAELEGKAANAERRATEAERDTAELLKAVASVQASRGGEGSIASNSARALAAGTLTGTIAVAYDPSRSPEENERLAWERRYQQEVARHRTQQARERAQLDEELHLGGLSAAERFLRLLAVAKEQAAQGRFREALRTYTQAVTAKPAELPLPDEAAALQKNLVAQGTPIEFTLQSDGVTYVSVANHQSPSRFTTTKLMLYPGDYEVTGWRQGFREVRLMLRLRNGAPVPALTIVCSEPLVPEPDKSQGR